MIVHVLLFLLALSGLAFCYSLIDLMIKFAKYVDLTNGRGLDEE